MTRIPAAERRAALVEAAIRVVAREGIAHATTRAIVAEAGMSLASFHYAFDSRDALIDEVIRTVVAREQQAVVPGPADFGDFAELGHGVGLRDLLEAGLLRYLDHLRVEPARELAMLELTLYALRSPERHPLAVMQYARYAELAAEALEIAAAASGARWRIPVAEVAHTLVAFTDGLTTTWLVGRDEVAARRVVAAAADALSRMADPA
ncbi:TetR/AcrR family transcriptional regulator [Agromyces sp. MMS24-JH15]|uniref:TetR/AcrR family transcriptional regulator n=1 Tax=Agromyces sp. MMS24-JH15 TaxID=3243765 RepID=UPI0037479F7A